jgi:hypothetical protein
LVLSGEGLISHFLINTLLNLYSSTAPPSQAYTTFNVLTLHPRAKEMSEPQKSEMLELEFKSTTQRGRLEEAAVYLRLKFEAGRRKENLKREGKGEDEAKKLATADYWENVGKYREEKFENGGLEK